MNNVQDFSNKHNLIESNDILIVAVSGGIDSMVLLHYLLQLRNTLNIELIVAHINHNVREESLSEYEFVKDYCKKQKIKFEGTTFDKNLDGNFHSSARTLRYNYFAEIALKYNSSKVLLAHHSDDQIETILMRISRGTTLKGYAGILPKVKFKNVFIIRPLLLTTKDNITKYSLENNINYVMDASNDSYKYTRNRFRHEIIPLFKKENCNFNSKISQLSEYIYGSYLLVQEVVDTYLKNYPNTLNKLTLDISSFNTQNDIVKNYILISIINKLSSNSFELTYEKLTSIKELSLKTKPNSYLTLGSNFTATKQYDEIVFAISSKKIDQYLIRIDGEGTYKIKDSIEYIVQKEKPVNVHKYYIEICYTMLVYPLFVRTRRNGDRMKFTYGTKKIKDIFINNKIPTDKRNSLPLLINSNNEVIWIPTVCKTDILNKGQNKIFIVFQRGDELEK